MKHACEKISHLASEKLERKLSLRELFMMQIHFLMCHACRQYSRNMLKLHQTLQLRLKAKDNEALLPDEKREKIKCVIQALHMNRG